MRILHTSDWHLGRQFHNVSLLEDQRHVLEQITTLIAEQQIDVVLLCGDIYDRSVPPAAAVQLLDDVLFHISSTLNVPVIMISGNHDGAERLGFAARQLEKSGIYIRTALDHIDQSITLKDQHGEVDFYCIPYSDPVSVRDVFNVDVRSHDEAMAVMVDRVRAKFRDDVRRVLLSHCYVEEGQASDSERPLSLGGAEQVRIEHFNPFHYAALGHLHAPQHKTHRHIRYSGSILKYSFSEVRQRKSVTIVSLDEDGQCNTEQHDLIPKRDMRIIEGYFEEILAGAEQDPRRDDYLLIRILDRHAILDVMAKLRRLYPNVLHVERPAFSQQDAHQVRRQAAMQSGEVAMFADFYQQMTGESWQEGECQFVTDVLQQIYQGEKR